MQDQENQGGHSPAGNFINEKLPRRSLKQIDDPDDDFEAELRKLQDLDENKVAMGSKGMTDEERAKARLSRVRTKMSNLMLLSKGTPNESGTPKGGGGVPNDQQNGFSTKLGAAFRSKFGVDGKETPPIQGATSTK